MGLGISQSNLAKQLKISLGDLITFEADMLLPDVNVLINLLRTLKCTIDYLIGRSSSPKETRNLQ